MGSHTACSLTVAMLLAVAGCGGSSGSVAPPTPGPTPPPPGPIIALENAFPNLTFFQPVAMTQAPGDPSRMFVVSRGGAIQVFDNDPAVTSTAVFGNISGRVNNSGEGGLLGMALHPDFATNGALFVSYTGGSPMQSRVSSFFANPGGTTLDDTSETILMVQDEPFSNHNIGYLSFGPGPAGSQQYLYVGFGDGGSGGDPGDNAQNPFSFHGSILRVDVSALTAYSIPPDNPFASGTTAAPETFAYGFRNPWRFSFDRAGGTLWAADVGQDGIEEVNIVTSGGNYGWRCYEGSAAFNQANCPGASAFTFPVAEYTHPPGGASVTGGFVYRGTAISNLQGVYLFSDFLSGTIWGLFPEGGGQFRMQVLLESGLNVVSFAQDLDGELYVLDFGGAIYRIVQGP